jgi:hypothetical protein
MLHFVKFFYLKYRVGIVSIACFGVKTVQNLYEFGKGKGKAIPLQALTGSEDSMRLRLPNVKTIST